MELPWLWASGFGLALGMRVGRGRSWMRVELFLLKSAGTAASELGGELSIVPGITEAPLRCLSATSIAGRSASVEVLYVKP